MAATAISAVDAAIHDLKARLLGLPLFRMLGSYRDSVPIYGSGGFTTYSDRELQAQLGGWVEREGCSLVKMKVGSQPDKDIGRVKAAKQAIGDRATLFVDANGAYRVQQALEFANEFAEQRVGWFEEPVSSDDLAGLRAMRRRAPVGTVAGLDSSCSASRKAPTFTDTWKRSRGTPRSASPSSISLWPMP